MPTEIEKRRDLICEAIAKRKVIQFRYENDLSNRVVEPFCCGMSSKDTYILRCFQIRGPSDSRRSGWKLLDLADMSDLEMLEEDYTGLRSGYNPRDRAIKKISCCRGRSPSI